MQLAQQLFRSKECCWYYLTTLCPTKSLEKKCTEKVKYPFQITEIYRQSNFSNMSSRCSILSWHNFLLSLITLNPTTDKEREKKDVSNVWRIERNFHNLEKTTFSSGQNICFALIKRHITSSNYNQIKHL